MQNDDDLTWSAPGAGCWELETSHHGGTMTPMFAAIYGPSMRAGSRASFRRYGIPASHLEMRLVNARPYMRVVPAFEPPQIMRGSQPPDAAAWLLSRTIPEMRRRAAAAQRAAQVRLWRSECSAWTSEREARVGENLALQDEPVDDLDDRGLADHLTRVAQATEAGVRRHFDLLAATCLPVGELAVVAQRHGVAAADVLTLLAGSSAASVATTHHLAAIAAATGRAVMSVDEIRTAGPEAARLLDDYLRLYGSRVVSRYDVDGLTLNELPQSVVQAVKGAAGGRRGGDSPHSEDVLAGLAPAARREVVAALDEARATYGARDDNVGVLMMWRIGLLRRAVLSAGRRLVARGSLERPESVFETSVEEIAALLRDPTQPVQELDARRRQREERQRSAAPDALGRPEVRPSLSALPPALARVAAGMLTFSDLMYTSPDHGPLTGAGIGSGRYTGRACVAADAADALSLLEPGDVLVCPFTTPAYNAVLPIASALVVEHGGPMSHAAIVARELGLPAVIGAAGVTAVVPQHALVCVDAAQGAVTVEPSAAGGVSHGQRR